LEYHERDWETKLGRLFSCVKKERVRQRMEAHFGKMLDLFDRMITQRLHLRKVWF